MHGFGCEMRGRRRFCMYDLKGSARGVKVGRFSATRAVESSTMTQRRDVASRVSFSSSLILDTNKRSVRAMAAAHAMKLTHAINVMKARSPSRREEPKAIGSIKAANNRSVPVLMASKI